MAPPRFSVKCVVAEYLTAVFYVSAVNFLVPARFHCGGLPRFAVSFFVAPFFPSGWYYHGCGVCFFTVRGQLLGHVGALMIVDQLLRRSSCVPLCGAFLI